MVKSSFRNEFETTLKLAKLKHSITINDVGTLVEQQLGEKVTGKQNDTFDYTKYHTLEEINQWIVNIQKAYPQLVTIINVTRSYEQRDIYAIKISVPNNRPNKKALWFDGGIHAREWFGI